MSSQGKEGREEEEEVEESGDDDELEGTQEEVKNIKIIKDIYKRLDILTRLENNNKEIKEKMQEATTLIRELKGKVEMMEEVIKKKDEEINGLKGRINALEQYGRNRNIEIHNVPEKNGENLEEITQKISEKLGIKITEEEIEVAHRIPTKNTHKPKPIIVQFRSRKIRDKIVADRKKTITQREVVVNGTSDRVFINENLSPYFKDLLWKAKNRAKELQYRFVWFSRGKVLMRKEEGKNVFEVKTEEDLAKLK